MRWLRPDHFATPAQGETYAVMRDMRAAGRPVDPVTASHEASRRGVQADLDDGTPAHAEASARELHKHATVARVGQAGREIQARAGDETQGLTAVFRGADRSLQMAETEAQIVRQHEPRQPSRQPGRPAPGRPGGRRSQAEAGREPAEATR